MNLLKGKETKDKDAEVMVKQRREGEDEESVVITAEELNRARKRLQRRKTVGENDSFCTF